MVVVILYVSVYWVFDGSDEDERDPNARRRYKSGLSLRWPRHRKRNG